MSRAMLGAGVAALLSCAAFAQNGPETPAFEVASIKPAAPQPAGQLRVMMRGGPGSPDPGQVTYTNVTLKNVMMNAYDVRGYQIQGPGWLDSERYDIIAKVPRDTTKEDFRRMLQNLLAERFKLALHREKKEVPIYSLVVGKNGPKMKESVDDPPSSQAAAPPGQEARPLGHGAPERVTVGKDGFPELPRGGNRMMMVMSNGRFRLNGASQPVAALVDLLSNQLGRPVTDNTGLTGKYDFTLDFAPEEGRRMPGPLGAVAPPPSAHTGEGGGASMNAPDAPAAPSLFTAVQEQLGLRLEQKKGPVDLLVIDRLEKTPTEN